MGTWAKSTKVAMEKEEEKEKKVDCAAEKAAAKTVATVEETREEVKEEATAVASVEDLTAAVKEAVEEKVEEEAVEEKVEEVQVEATPVASVEATAVASVEDLTAAVKEAVEETIKEKMEEKTAVETAVVSPKASAAVTVTTMKGGGTRRCRHPRRLTVRNYGCTLDRTATIVVDARDTRLRNYATPAGTGAGVEKEADGRVGPYVSPETGDLVRSSCRLRSAKKPKTKTTPNPNKYPNAIPSKTNTQPIPKTDPPPLWTRLPPSPRHHHAKPIPLPSTPTTLPFPAPI